MKRERGKAGKAGKAFGIDRDFAGAVHGNSSASAERRPRVRRDAPRRLRLVRDARSPVTVRSRLWPSVAPGPSQSTAALPLTPVHHGQLLNSAIFTLHAVTAVNHPISQFVSGGGGCSFVW